MPKAALIGAGLIGRSWAVVFARAGWDVAAYDTDLATLAAMPDMARRALEQLRAAGLCRDPDAALARIATVDTMDAAVVGADLVQESGPERPEMKQALFEALDKLADPTTILASSTSAIMASHFTEHLPGRARCLVAHPVNPPHLVPLVELSPAPWTDPAIVDRAEAIYRAVGQSPIRLHREIEGFVLNRLQSALLSEAFRLVQDGVVSARDLDVTIRDGLGLRWSFMGPFETIDLNAPGGIADYCARYAAFYGRVAADPPPAQVFDPDRTASMAAAWIGNHPTVPHADRMAWRDGRLVALMAHKATQPNSAEDGAARAGSVTD